MIQDQFCTSLYSNPIIIVIYTILCSKTAVYGDNAAMLGPQPPALT